FAGSLLPCPPALALGCAAAMLLLFLFWQRVPVLLALVFCAGSLSYRETVALRSPYDVARLVSGAQSAGVRGVIVSAPQSRDGERAHFTLRLSALRLAEEWEPAKGLLWMSGPAALRYGDEIESVAALRAPEPARNPGGFDQRGWLAREGISFTASIATNDPCAVLARDCGNALTALSLRLRARFERALRCGLETEPEMAGVLAGMVIGERAGIPADTYADFQRTGVFHVFAVSGLHVGLIAALVLTLLRAAQVPTRWSGAPAIPLLVLYVWATGAHPGAVRAFAMAGVWLMGRMLLRPADGLNNLAAAALILLVWEPLELFDGGFHLSFVVVAAILVLAPRIQERLQQWFAWDPLLPRRLAPRWQAFLEKPKLWFLQLLSCSIAAWIGLVPLLATYFHLFTPSSIVANLLVVPLLTGVTALGMTATLAHAVWPWLAATFNNAGFFLLSVMTTGVEWIGRMPGSHLYVQTPPVWLTAAYYALGLLLLARTIPWRWRRWTVGVGAPVAAGVALFTAQPEEFAELTVLDIPDGVAAFVNLPGERDDLLIDGGGERVLLPLLRSQGVDRLGSVVLTAKDKAHVAGLSNIVAEVSLRGIVMTDMPSRSLPYRRWREQANARRVPVRTLHAGAQWQAQQLKFTALSPPGDSRATRADDNSLVLLIEYGPTRLLWMSDAGATIERRLAASGMDLRCPILIKASHNKEPSGTEELLDAVRPELVVQIANRWPVQRNPDPALRERVEQRGARWLCTEDTGAVTLRLTSRGYWVRTCREAAGTP
ncbi:MAG: DNA internalization-related competence protein ComEC/Rec2, partial [Verrucomicrobia bacterium]|nr:DNA internalization-related competence protein ComEC/Rec2 [Verrucomicrobiota bacterium]